MPAMNRETAILVTLVAYKVVLLAIGFWGQKRTHTTEDFYLGGRRLGPLVAAVSAAASSSSAWTIVGVSGLAYAWGYGALWLFPACVGGFLINWFVLAPGLRRHTRATGAITVTEILAGTEGRPLRGAITWIASVIVIVALGLYVSSQLQAAGRTFSNTFEGLSFMNSVLIGGGIVVVYTLVGGFWAVSLTDTLQGLLMAATAIVLPVAAIAKIGGFGALHDGLVAVDDGRSLGLFQDHGGIAAIGFALGLLGIGFGYPGQPHVVNRIMAMGGDDRTLGQAKAIAISWAVVVYAGMLLLGLCGRVLYPCLPRDDLFITATNGLFPPIVAGVMIAAVLSAIMSTADSQLLVTGSTVSHDLGLGGTSTKTMLLRSRITVLLVSVGAIVAALATPKDIFNNVLFAFGAMGAAFGPALLYTALRGRPPSPMRTLLAMVAGCGLSIFAYYAYAAPADKAMERVLPYLVSMTIVCWPKARRTV